MNPPELTDAQRQAALSKAAEVRRTRAELKELLKIGSLSFAELIERSDGDETIAGMKIAAVLPSLPGMGKIKAKRLMEEVGIADNRRIRGLGAKQRAALLDTFS